MVCFPGHVSEMSAVSRSVFIFLLPAKVREDWFEFGNFRTKNSQDRTNGAQFFSSGISLARFP